MNKFTEYNSSWPPQKHQCGSGGRVVCTWPGATVQNLPMTKDALKTPFFSRDVLSPISSCNFEGQCHQRAWRTDVMIARCNMTEGAYRNRASEAWRGSTGPAGSAVRWRVGWLPAAVASQLNNAAVVIGAKKLPAASHSFPDITGTDDLNVWNCRGATIRCLDELWNQFPRS